MCHARFAGLIPAYARYGQFGNAFVDTRFLHIAHNLDTSYEGRLYPAVEDRTLDWMHGLPTSLLVDPFWGGSPVLNPTRAALMCSNSWATVSKSYREVSTVVGREANDGQGPVTG